MITDGVSKEGKKMYNVHVQGNIATDPVILCKQMVYNFRNLT